MATVSQSERMIAVLTAWAKRTPSVLALALVGSHARGTAGADSDIDLMLIAREPHAFHNSDAWVNDIDWDAAHSSLTGWDDVKYGRVWSRHFRFADGTTLELTFADPSWAALDPLDAGTRDVIAGGCRVLVDHEHLFGQLLTYAA